MKVYMSGLIYLKGCEGGLRAYAPEGTGHYASLWIEARALNEEATQWWDGLRNDDRVVKGVTVVEFKIPGPAVIEFPGKGIPECINLEDGLAKLKTKKKNAKKNDPEPPEEDFQVNPATAKTNAEVEMRGGTVTPFHFRSRGLIEWTISDPGLRIVVASRDNADDSGTITLAHSEAHVLFLNSHDLPKVHGEKDTLRGEHVAAFKNLNPDPSVTVYPVRARAPHNVEQLPNDISAELTFVIASGCSCGAATPCCCK